jgi:hypothetical protein
MCRSDQIGPTDLRQHAVQYFRVGKLRVVRTPWKAFEVR